MKKILFTSLVTLFSISIAHAVDHTGAITKINLNSAVSNRGICIQMSPTIPTTNQWACLYDESKHLYKEMSSMLLTAYAAKSQCRITWAEEIDSKGVISLIECQ